MVPRLAALPNILKLRKAAIEATRQHSSGGHSLFIYHQVGLQLSRFHLAYGILQFGLFLHSGLTFHQFDQLIIEFGQPFLRFGLPFHSFLSFGLPFLLTNEVLGKISTTRDTN